MTTRRQQHAVILAVVALALTAVATTAGLLVAGTVVLWGGPAAAAAGPAGTSSGPSTTPSGASGAGTDPAAGDAEAVAGSSMVGGTTPDAGSPTATPTAPPTGAWVTGRDWANGTYATHCGTNPYGPAQQVALRAGRHTFGDVGLPDTVLRLREKVSVTLGDDRRYVAVVLDCSPGNGATTSQVFLFRLDDGTPHLLGEAVPDTERLAVDAVSQNETRDAVVVTGSGWSPGTPVCCPDETRLYSVTPLESGLSTAAPVVLSDRTTG